MIQTPAPSREAVAAAPSRSSFPLPGRLAYPAAVVTGLLYWIAFPGKAQLGAWQSLVSLLTFVPLWLAMQGQTPRRAAALGVVAGATMNFAGFTWMLTMLQVFSGFPLVACLGFMAIVCTYQGGRIGLMGWLFARATRRGWPAAAVFVAAFAVSELCYPLLFPWYFAATAFRLPALWQTAEIGGPILVGSLLVGTSIALAEPVVARLSGARVRMTHVVVPLAALGLALAFAAYRIPDVDRIAQASEAVHVGMVQGNLGLIEKREDPAESLRRHLLLTDDLKQRGADFVVWSESSVSMPMPERSYAVMVRELYGHLIGVPAIIGSVLVSDNGLQQVLYNAALSVDSRGSVTGRYDKQYLLAFGEYLPLGETFPKLYEWSPSSGRFTPGTTIDPLPITLGGMTHPVSVLICYEDIIPSFTNRMVSFAHPDLLVNMTNDAWFGDSSEPWEHLALAQLRAVEHRRYLVRSTNSGVSAVVDPVGRVMVHGGTFDAEALDAIVHWMHPKTIYEVIGDSPWIVLSLALFAAAFVRRKGLPLAAAVLAAACSSSSPARPADAQADVHPRDATDDTTTADTASPTGDAGPCPVLAAVNFVSPICGACMAHRCCTASTPCYAITDADTVPDCALLADCVANCVEEDGAGVAGDAGDAGGADAGAVCRAHCQTQYGDGAGVLATMTACLEHQCTNDGGTGPCDY